MPCFATPPNTLIVFIASSSFFATGFLSLQSSILNFFLSIFGFDSILFLHLTVSSFHSDVTDCQFCYAGRRWRLLLLLPPAPMFITISTFTPFPPTSESGGNLTITNSNTCFPVHLARAKGVLLMLVHDLLCGEIASLGACPYNLMKPDDGPALLCSTLLPKATSSLMSDCIRPEKLLFLVALGSESMCSICMKCLETAMLSCR